MADDDTKSMDIIFDSENLVAGRTRDDSSGRDSVEIDATTETLDQNNNEQQSDCFHDEAAIVTSEVENNNLSEVYFESDSNHKEKDVASLLSNNYVEEELSEPWVLIEDGSQDDASKENALVDSVDKMYLVKQMNMTTETLNLTIVDQQLNCLNDESHGVIEVVENNTISEEAAGIGTILISASGDKEKLTSKEEIEDFSNFWKEVYVSDINEVHSSVLIEINLLINYYHSKCKTLQDLELNDETENTPKTIVILQDNEVDEHLELLWKCLEFENLISAEVLASKEFILSYVQHSAKVFNSDISSDMCDALQKLKLMIQPLDIDLLFELIESARVSGDQLNGKDIVVFIGETGSGKSTTIHFLSGSVLDYEVVDGFEHLEVKSCANELQDIVTKVSTKSVTKVVKTVLLESGILLCDTPGFNDTQGPVYDIANGVGVAAALSQSKTLKPVVVLSKDGMGSRLQNIKSICKILLKFFQNIDDILPSLCYVFTKYERKNATNICKQLDKFRRDLSEEDRRDKYFMSLLDDIIIKTTPKASLIIPIDDDGLMNSPDLTLSLITSGIAVAGKEGILNNFISSESYARLSDQMRVIERAITQGLQNHNVSSIYDLFMKISKLSNLDIVKHVASTFEDLKCQMSNYIKDLLKDARQSLHSVAGTPLSEVPRILVSCLTRFKQLFLLHDVATTFIVDMFNVADTCTAELLEFHRNLFVQVMESNSLSKPELYSLIWKLKMIVVVTEKIFFTEKENDGSLDLLPRLEKTVPILLYDTLCNQYNESIVWLKCKIDETVAAISTAFVNEKSVQSLAVYFDNLDAGIKIYSEYNSSTEYVNVKQELLVSFWERLDATISNALTVLDQDQTFEYLFSADDLSYLSHMSSMLNTIKDESLNLDRHMKCSQRIIEIIESTRQSINCYSHNFNKKVLSLLNEGPTDVKFKLVSIFIRNGISLHESLPIFFDICTTMMLSLAHHIKSKLDEICQCFSHLVHKSADVKASSDDVENMIINLSSLYDAHIHLGQYKNIEIMGDLYNNEYQNALADVMKMLEIFLPACKHIPLDMINITMAVSCHHILFVAEKFLKIPENLTKDILTLCKELVANCCEVLKSSKQVVCRFFSLDYRLLKLDHMTLCVDFADIINMRLKSHVVSYGEEILSNFFALQFEEMCQQLFDAIDKSFSSNYSSLVQHLERCSHDEINHIKTIVDNLHLDVKILSQFHKLYNADLPYSFEGTYHHLVFKSKPSSMLSTLIYEKEALLPRLVTSLNEKMKLVSKDDANNIPTIHFFRIVSEASSKFDKYFLGDDIASFNSVVVNSVQYLQEMSKNALQKMTLCIDKLEFEELKDLCVEAQAASDFLQTEGKLLKDHLETFVNGKINSIQKVINNLTSNRPYFEALEVILDCHKPLRDVESNVLDLLSPQMSEKMTSLLRISQEKISAFFLSLIAKVKGDMLLKEYSECFSILSNCDNICHLLSGSEFPHHERFKSLFTKMEDELFCDITEAINLYTTMHPKTYTTNPPSDLWDQLLKAPGAKYNDLKSDFRDKVEANVKAVLLEVKNHPDNITQGDDAITCIQQCNLIIPAEFQKLFLILLKECEDIIAKKKDELNKSMQEKFDGDSFHQLKDQYALMASYYYPDYYSMNEIIRCIRRLIKKEDLKFRKYMSNKDSCLLINNFPGAYLDFRNYLKMVKDANSKAITSGFGILTVTSDIESSTTVKDLRSAVFSYINTEFLSINSFQLVNNELDSFFRKAPYFLDVIQATMKFKDSHNELYLFFMKNITANVSNCTSHFTKIVVSVLESVGVEIENALKNKNVAFLKFSFDIFQENERFIQDFYAFLNGKSISTSSNKFFHDLNYKKLVEKLSTSLLSWKDIVDQTFLNNERTSTPNSSDRNEFYVDIYKSFISFKEIKLISVHVDQHIFNVDIFIGDQEAHIHDQLTKFKSELEKLLLSIPSENVDTYGRYNICLDNLRSFGANFKDGKLSAYAYTIISDLEISLNVKIRELRDNALNILAEETPDNIVRSLITLKVIGTEITSFSKTVNSMIDAVLSRFMKKNANRFAQLCIFLTQHTDPVAHVLLSQHKAFEDYKVAAKNMKILKVGIEYIAKEVRYIEELPIQRIQVEQRSEELMRLFKIFESSYWKTVEKGYNLEIKSEQQDFLSSLVNRAETTASDESKPLKDRYQLLLVEVFAYWTLERWFKREIQRTTGEEDSTDISSRKNELLQPHAAQIVAILRLLGIDISSSQATENHLAQISTGEGKSVTLAGIALILALTGRHVDCACYSAYLSNRDYMSFLPLFQAFRVSEHIKYGTFDAVCEDFLNRKGNVRSTVATLFGSTNNSYDKNQSKQYKNYEEDSSEFECKEDMQSNSKRPNRRNDRPRVLLIDEVDVFLNEDFYGGCYHPLAKIKHQTFSDLVEYIWTERHNREKLNFSSIKNTPEYVAFNNHFSDWKEVADSMVRSMCYDVTRYENHDYLFESGRIGYKEQDGISFTTTYGFKTLFAYFHHRDLSQVEKSFVEGLKFIPIDCGTYSYAEIPKLYSSILGVSGTLETLSTKENELLSTVYNIKKCTIIPSVYGKSNFQFSERSGDDVRIEAEGYFHIEIHNEIRKRIKGSKDQSYERAVLVFFETLEELNKFYVSLPCKNLQKPVIKITEELSSTEKENNIIKSVSSGSVCLLTKAFGRGTDFICYDDKLQDNGGIHVIQTFLSELRSEEIQIMGRTSRQGNCGSYSLVLLDRDLERYNMTQKDISELKDTGSYYKDLAKFRDQYFEDNYLDTIKHKDEISKDHFEAMTFLDNLFPSVSNLSQIKEFLLKRNRFMSEKSERDVRSRTICLMDATGSMRNLIDKAKRTISTMFERASEILEDNGITGGFDMQFAAYRNYNAVPDMLLQYSGWSTKPNEIKTFLSNLQTQYGIDEEAVEIGFWHVNNEHEIEPVSQIILIADEPSNSRSQTDSRRAKYNSAFVGTCYEKAVYIDEEFEKIIDNGIIVHAFYLTETAKQQFVSFAERSGGTHGALDIHSNTGADMLTDLITKRILEQKGGDSMGSTLLAAYDLKYGKKGHVEN